MLIWTWMTYACAMLLVGVGVAGELSGSDLWSLVVEAEKDAPNRRITPKHLFSTPNHNRNRPEQCQQGFRYDHMGKCVPVRKPGKVDLQSELANLRRRAQILKPAAQFTSELPAASTGPYYVSIPLAVKMTTARTYPTTTSESPVATPPPQPLIPILTAQPDSSTESIPTNSPSSTEKEASTEKLTTTSSATSTEKGTTTSSITSTEKEITAPSASSIEKATTTENETEVITTESAIVKLEPFSKETESSTRTNVSEPLEEPTVTSLPSAITDENLIGTSTLSDIEGSGKVEEVEGSGYEGSGFAAPIAEEIEDDTTTVRYIDNRPLRSTTRNDETTIDSFLDESTLATPTATKPSLLLSILKGDLKNDETTEKSTVETTTQYPVTTTEETENTEWLPIVEYVDIDFPKDIEKNRSGPVENIEWKYSETENKKQPIEIPKEEPVQKVPPGVFFFEFKKDDEFPEEVKDSFTDEWVKELPSPWVRFPDNFEDTRRRDYLSRGQEFAPSGSGFRFPEEVVQPEHRPTLLKFWSKIPMYQSDSNFKRQYSDIDGF